MTVIFKFTVLYNNIYKRKKKNLNEYFKNKLEVVQYNAALIITGVIQDTFRECVYKELGLESLAERICFRVPQNPFLSQNDQ